jgi:hypothetical protein
LVFLRFFSGSEAKCNTGPNTQFQQLNFAA